MYKYVGRSTAGIHKLKQQNAVVELESIVTVQSVDEYTLAVQVSSSIVSSGFRRTRTDNEDCFFFYSIQLTYTTVKRNGYFLGNPLDRTQDIEGENDEMPDLDVLYAPFNIYHKQGSVRTDNDFIWTIKYNIMQHLLL